MSEKPSGEGTPLRAESQRKRRRETRPTVRCDAAGQPLETHHLLPASATRLPAPPADS